MVRYSVVRNTMSEQELNPYASPNADVDAPSASGKHTLKYVLFSFSGRINRFEYWVLGVLPIIAMYIAIAIVGFIFESSGILNSPAIATVVLVSAYLPALWIGLAISIKRWHDRNKSGMWIFLGLVPIIGSIWSFIEVGCLAGSDGPNRYGPEPQR
jgi:uncharacterized membrane protein YhaH (DUF805 family)